MSNCIVWIRADSSMREVGLNLAVATMRKGERCLVQMQPLYGYGEKGMLSLTISRMPWMHLLPFTL
jgi:hypothetical protein